MTREALASSRIEGTQASLSEVLQAEAGDVVAQTEDIAEVERYLAAARQGLDLIKELPISGHLILRLHQTLLEGVRGEEKMPGRYRQTPVWVGSPTDRPENATYVPPFPAEVAELLPDWEEFVNQTIPMPVLIRCGLMHYQFETIHPFLDGNGRIGRLLINLMLLDQKRLTTPLLYLSGYLERHRSEYYERLQGVRERGEVQEWLQFFLTAIKFQADDAVERAGQLVNLREQYFKDAAKSRSNLAGLVDILFTNPFVTVSRVERILDITNQGSRNLIRHAEDRGWLVEIGTAGRGGKTYWLAEKIFEVIEAPMSYE
jgi:Fic family protein